MVMAKAWGRDGVWVLDMAHVMDMACFRGEIQVADSDKAWAGQRHAPALCHRCGVKPGPGPRRALGGTLGLGILARVISNAAIRTLGWGGCELPYP